MTRTRGSTLPLPLFIAVSFGLHSAAFRALRYDDVEHARAFEPSSQGLTGETLDVDDAPALPDESDDPAPATTASPPAAQAAPSPPSPAPGPAAHTRSSAQASVTEAAAAAAARPAQFGAVGVRFAADLATTFTRAFPQAASADPVWPTVSFGATSSAELVLVLDDDGHLVRTAITGAPSVALRRGIERTLALLGMGRAFTAHGALTRIRITARVSRDDVHDGLHGDVFALSGGSFSGDVGNAFFALPPTAGPGRRIDVELRLLP